MTPRARLAHLAQYGTPPDRETANRITVGLDDTLVRIEKEVFPYLADGGSELQFVFGANGRGKTHYLLALEERARRAGFATARIDCSSVGSPFASMRLTYEMVANTLSAPISAGAVAAVGLPALIQASVEGKSDQQITNSLKALRASRQLSPDFRNLVIGYAHGIHEGRFTERLTDQLEALLNGSSTRSVTVSDLYKADRMLPRPLGKLTNRSASVWLRSLLSLPGALGFKGVLVMFDETERVLHKLNSHQKRSQLANIRNLVDYCALSALSGCMILYAASEDFVETARRDLDALAQRIEPPSLLKDQSPSSIRSVWTDLDDLTNPQTHDVGFFERVGEKMIEIGIDAGLAHSRKATILSKLSTDARRQARSLTSSTVRDFVKLAATTVLTEVKANARR
jgi:hypothetical protein